MRPSVNRQPGSPQGWLYLPGIIIPLLVMEWNYSRPGFTLPLILSYPGWLAGLCLPLVILMRTRIALSPAARATFNRFLFLGLGFVLVLTLQGVLHPEAATTYSQFLLIEFVALPLWGIAGFLYAAQADSTERLLGVFALCAAWGSVFSFGLRLAGVPVSIPFVIAGWPMRLFFLFGFCWYLSRFLAAARVSHRTLAGLVACGLEVVITLQKPIIWTTLFSVATLLLIFRTHLTRRRFGKTMTTLLKSTVAVVLVLVAVNSVSQGVVTQEIKAFISNRVIHQTEEEDTITLRRAAGGRFELWEVVLKDFGVSPWVGSGVKEIESEGGSVSMHNGYLDLLFIAGICGFIPVAIGGGILLRRVVRSLNGRSMLLVQSSCLAYIVGILMFNLGGTSRLFPGVSYFIALVCGISLRLAVDSRPQTIQVAPRPSTPPDRFVDVIRSA